MEEEHLLVDARDGSPTATGAAVVTALAAGRDGGGLPAAETELHRQQVETGSAPHTDLGALAADLRARRHALDDAAAGLGSRLVALAAHPGPVEPVPSVGERYERIVERFGLPAREQLTCGCHVHVEVADRDEAAAVVDRLRPWTPLLLALSANSPTWQGRDTGYASYRARVWDRWPTAGPAPTVGDAAGWDRLVERVLATGVPLDAGQVYCDVRVSARWPTVEVRVADVCLRVDDAVLLAALTRALVDTAVSDHRAGTPLPGPALDVARLAAWRAAKDGVEGQLLHPADGRPRPAADALAALLDHLGPALAATGDTDLVTAGVRDVLARGTGARWQRGRRRDGAATALLLREAAALTRDG